MTLPRKNIADLSPKEEVQSVFLVKYIAMMEAKDGKPYLNLVFSDASGDLEARSWNNVEDIYKTIEKGQFALVSGKVNLFQGRKQFIVQSCESVSRDQVNMDDFIMKASQNPEEMYKDLLKIVTDLDDVYIKELLENILNDQEISRRLKIWQAGKSIHHAYQSGLLEHILSCSNLAVSLSKHYKANVNYVVAGTILHDLCKIYELTDGVNVDYTEEGKLVGHLVKSLEVIDKFSYRISDFPHQTKIHLKHIMLSHHGEYSFGSPKIPQTSEAMLVHLIDLMDSKMHSFETVKKTDNTTGHWSGYVKHLDRIIYKGDLPHFQEKVSREEQKANTPPKAQAPVKSKDIKQNLGSLLKDFKID